MVPWTCVFIGPDGRRQTRERWSRPSAAAVDIADEVMALFARKIMDEGGDRDLVEKLLAGCVVQVTRPAYEGWPAEYGEAHGATWLEDARERIASGDLGEVA